MALKLPKAPKLKMPKLPKLKTPKVKSPKLPKLKTPKMPTLGIASFFASDKAFNLMISAVVFLPAIVASIYLSVYPKTSATKYISIFAAVFGLIGIWVGMVAPLKMSFGVFFMVYLLLTIAFMANSPLPPPKEDEKKEEAAKN